MQHLPSCILAGAVAAFALTAFVASPAGIPAGSQAETRIASQAAPSRTTVNRALKGDRLTAPPVTVQHPPRKPERLSTGCLAAVSALADRALARIPAQCVAQTAVPTASA
jgi:hypothetical protein